MIKRIEEILKAKLDSCKNKVFPYADLTMKNGDYITVEAPSSWKWGGRDFTVVTNDDEVIHFNILGAVSEWIAENYC